MKSTGIVRKVDELGRVVIPIELRRVLGVSERDPMEIYTDGDKIILKKYSAANTCAVTGEITDAPETIVLPGTKQTIVVSPEGKEALKKLIG